MIPEDATLLDRYATERREEAFAELVRRHVNQVYSSALRRLGGDAQLAQDVTQEVFVSLARDAARLSRHPTIAGWLHTTTRNAAANLVRAERRRKRHEEEIQRMPETLAQESTPLDWSRLAPVLEKALDQLSDPDRLAVLLRYSEQQSFGEIGRILKLTDEAARKRVDRALDKLRDRLKHHGIVSSAAALGLVLTNQAVSAAPMGFAATITSAALAATPAGAATAASLLGLMSTTKLALSCAAMVGVILSLSLAVHEYQLQQKAETSLHADAENETALLSERNALSAKAAALEAEAARLTQAQSDARLAKAERERKAVAAKPTDRWDPKKEGTAFLDRHPEARQALRERFLATVRSQYGALFESLGLTPEQQEQFALLKIRGSSMGGSRGGAGPNAEKYILYSVDSEERGPAYGAAIHDLLGEAGWKKYQDYNSMLPARDLTIQVASQLSFTETPLTPEQSDRLISVLASNQSKIPGTSVLQFNWEPVMAEVGGILSPSQQSALELLRAKADLQISLGLAMSSPPKTRERK